MLLDSYKTSLKRRALDGLRTVRIRHTRIVATGAHRRELAICSGCKIGSLFENAGRIRSRKAAVEQSGAPCPQGARVSGGTQGSVGQRMTWSLEDIERGWIGGEASALA